MTPEARPTTDLIAAYRRGAETLRSAVSGMSADELRARPVSGKLSSLEVACHIVDSDQFMCDRLKRTIAIDRPLLVGVASFDYVGALRYHERNLDLDLELLAVQRQQMAEDLDRLADKDWERTAVHTENGTQTLVEILEHAVEHLEDHVASIYEKRAALGR